MNIFNEYNLLRELFTHANESIIVLDSKGKICILNPATEKLFGYTQEELIGQAIEILVPSSAVKNHKQEREKYTKNPHARKMGIGLDLYAKKKDDTEFPVEISLSPFNNDGQRFVIAFIINITKRKLVEIENVKNQQQLEKLTKELKLSNEKLELKVHDRTKVLQEALNEIEKSRTELSEALEKEKELNELKSRFLSMASHEFRTPLTTILSSATLIADYPKSEQQEKRIKHVERIGSAVNNLNDILSDFLSLSKIEEGKVEAQFKEIDIKNTIDEIASELKGICKKGQQIIFTHKGETLVQLDPKLLRNILINLISNAIKFSDENKSIYITCNVTKLGISLKIKDEGMGISKEDQEHLFQRFFRGQNAMNIQGTGLGLNIVARYVELMFGKISLQSELEKGTMVSMNFKNK